MTPKSERWLLVVLIILLIASVMFAMSGCGARYQPPGEDLWLAL